MKLTSRVVIAALAAATAGVLCMPQIRRGEAAEAFDMSDYPRQVAMAYDRVTHVKLGYSCGTMSTPPFVALLVGERGIWISLVPNWVSATGQEDGPLVDIVGPVDIWKIDKIDGEHDWKKVAEVLHKVDTQLESERPPTLNYRAGVSVDAYQVMIAGEDNIPYHQLIRVMDLVNTTSLEFHVHEPDEVADYFPQE